MTTDTTVLTTIATTTTTAGLGISGEQANQIINELSNIQVLITFFIGVGVVVVVYKLFRMFF